MRVSKARIVSEATLSREVRNYSIGRITTPRPETSEMDGSNTTVAEFAPTDSSGGVRRGTPDCSMEVV
jgi:hypothetical protein